MNALHAVLLTVGLVLGAAVANAADPWSLERALAYALTNSPDAQLARHRIAAARAGLEQAKAAYWPQLQVQSSYTRTDNPMLVFGSVLNQRAYSPSLDFNDVPDVDNLNARGLVSLPLYAGGRNRAQKTSATANTAAARAEAAAVRNTLGFEVARAYHTILKTREFVRAAQAAVTAYETNLAIAGRRLQAGALLRTDVLDLEVRLAQAREDLARARNANVIAERTLRNLLGIEQGDFTVADAGPAPEVPQSQNFSRRPELAAAGQRERVAEGQVKAVGAGYLPQVSAFGSLDYDYGWKYTEGGGSYTAGAMLNWKIWDGKLTRAKVRQAQAELESAREQTRSLKLALDLELERARLDLETARERTATMRQAVAKAVESATLTRARFEQGSALPTQVIDTETALLAARVRLAEAEADQRVAVAGLRKALALPQLDSLPNADAYEPEINPEN
jgi:outer membrane protein